MTNELFFRNWDASPAKAPQKLNRKQRKALEAKQRIAFKIRKRVTG